MDGTLTKRLEAAPLGGYRREFSLHLIGRRGLATRPDAALSPHHTFTPPPTCPPAAATGSAVVLVRLLSAPEARLRAR